MISSSIVIIIIGVTVATIQRSIAFDFPGAAGGPCTAGAAAAFPRRASAGDLQGLLGLRP